MSVGEKLKALREYSDLSQSEVANIISNLETSSAISKWESNERLPSIFQLAELSEMFQVSNDYIISTSETYCNVGLLYIKDFSSITYKDLKKPLRKCLGELLFTVMSNNTKIWECFVISYDEKINELDIDVGDKIIIHQVSDGYAPIVYFYNKKEKKYYIRKFITYSDGSKWLIGGESHKPLEFDDRTIKIIGNVLSIICEN